MTTSRLHVDPENLQRAETDIWALQFARIEWYYSFLLLHTGREAPRWLSWMHHPTGDQEVAGSTPAEVSNILSWRLIMKYFLWSFSPFSCFQEGQLSVSGGRSAQYLLTA